MKPLAKVSKSYHDGHIKVRVSASAHHRHEDVSATVAIDLSLEDATKFMDDLTGAIEKEEAKYFFERTNPETSDVSIKRKWRATEMGQRQILLKNYFRAMDKLLDSLRSRLYSIY